MNCTTEARSVPGLKPRRAAGLRRPTKSIPGLGAIEYVREERCHTWQLSHQFVPTRLTLIDGILGESEEPTKATEFFSRLVEKERGIREGAIRARYFEFISPECRQPSMEEILLRLDEWAVPYRIDRCGEVCLTLKYDCVDAPGKRLLGAEQVHVSVEPDWSISEVRYFSSGIAGDLLKAAYKQRVLPASFVMDSIADQFILTPYVKPTAELAALLKESILQTDALVQKSAGAEQAFMRCAHSLLCKRRDSDFSDFA